MIKKSVKKTTVKAKPKAKPKAKTVKSTKSKSKAKKEVFSDSGIVIVDDDIEIDQEKVNEERRAYLEEARSQEVSD